MVIDLSEQGLERIEQEWTLVGVLPKAALQTEDRRLMLALVSALRQARADLENLKRESGEGGTQ